MEVNQSAVASAKNLLNTTEIPGETAEGAASPKPT